MRKLISICLTMALAVCSTVSNASLMTCTSAEIAAFTGATGCYVGQHNNDKLNPLTVNTDTMFGYDDWKFSDKQAKGNSVSFGQDSMGYEHMMIVLKGGKGNTTQSNYIGYMLNMDMSYFEWSTPFFKPTRNRQLNIGKDISHWTLYVRGEVSTGPDVTILSDNVPPTSVPEPGTLALFGLAGIGLMLGRRKQLTS